MISGTIIAVGGSGQAIVTSPAGLLELAARPAGSQIGTGIRLEILARTDAPASARPSPGANPASGSGSRGGTAAPGIEAGASPLSLLSRNWPALEESLRALEIALPQGAAQLAASIARPGPQLTASMLFFLSAIRAGSPGGWLGREAATALERTRPDLFSALTGDFSTLFQASENSSETAGWRSFFIPFQNGETLEQLRFLVLPAGQEAPDQEGEHPQQSGSGGPGTRFILDLELTALGGFRLDGSVTGQSLSLMIRTRRELPAGIRAGIIEVFGKTAARTGLEGAVNFGVQKDFPPLPLAEPATSSGQALPDPVLYA